ncbi:Protein YdcF [Colletotrichum fructicola]|uniref:Duf218 domain protein n=2 Tax=Colletotrichum gloeosporioides species complex TaxID=2707338 RepID=L2FB83_COLFN|nr:uncharacterized protein CGMCC3_g2434 [Colletotrichum fructicola]KAF4490788.1 Protein YdcF [Colletotrichum fructicola Nara gc5]KAK1846354.1 DUF218 domain protein [Colletotrichum chrysophilum]KAE9582070.1 hypothetical protein CGMCC3_g2434 [Colletotrichum fructicola]KAF4424999.1 Protein YdcF [Colletotrichum fructicola]KAF4891276.1 Protein YdcF [Colletotrichum fructicola]
MAEAADAVNVLSRFLSDERIDGVSGVNRFFESLPTSQPRNVTPAAPPTDAIVFCASSVLALADVVFSAFNGGEPSGNSALDQKIDLDGRRTVLVLCGGIGHSTPFLYDAVARHPIYNVIADEVQGKPEARVLQLIAERWFGIQALEAGPEAAMVLSNDRDKFVVVVEDRSTNCGANASESKQVLEACGITSPRSIIVVQDPTMSKRTVATFEKTYAMNHRSTPHITSWPTFTPKVHVKSGVNEEGKQDPLALLQYSGQQSRGITSDGLWDMGRFVDLLMGEVPRLRDDVNGYGPNGKGFLVHVDIPEAVERAWKYLDNAIGAAGRDR